MQIDSLPSWLIFVHLFRVNQASESLACLTPSFLVLRSLWQCSKQAYRLCFGYWCPQFSSSFPTPGVLTFIDWFSLAFTVWKVPWTEELQGYWSTLSTKFAFPTSCVYRGALPFLAFQRLSSIYLPKCLWRLNGPHLRKSFVKLFQTTPTTCSYSILYSCAFRGW